MGLTSEYDIVERIEDYEGEIFAYTVKCTLSKNNLMITEGFGSCNSKEDRYRWRWIKEKDLPKSLEKENLKSKTDKYGNKVYRVENEDICSQVNTILKMAKKRAQIDATLTVAALSEIFTQDIEDMDIQGNVTENTYKPTASEPGEVVINFGKHSGSKLKDVPEDYLQWLSKNARDDDMKKAAKSLLEDEQEEDPGKNRKHFFAKVQEWSKNIGCDNAWAKETAQELIRESYGIESCSRLTDKEWGKVVENFDKLQEKLLNRYHQSEENEKVNDDTNPAFDEIPDGELPDDDVPF